MTAPTLARRVGVGTYRTSLTVERAMVRRGLAATEGAAHQKLLTLRATVRELYAAFLDAGALERHAWFVQPAEALMGRRVALPLAEAILAKSNADATEDAKLTELTQRLEDPTFARAYLRTWYRERAAGDTVAQSICQRHGFTE